MTCLDSGLRTLDLMHWENRRFLNSDKKVQNFQCFVIKPSKCANSLNGLNGNSVKAAEDRRTNKRKKIVGIFWKNQENQCSRAAAIIFVEAQWVCQKPGFGAASTGNCKWPPLSFQMNFQTVQSVGQKVVFWMQDYAAANYNLIALASETNWVPDGNPCHGVSQLSL